VLCGLFGEIYSYSNPKKSSKFRTILLGLSSGNIPDGSVVGNFPNSYAIPCGYNFCWLSQQTHYFDLPNGAIKPKWNGRGDVMGCGLLMNPENKLSIFFTGNGILMGQSLL
jgi:hypothetical protein